MSFVSPTIEPQRKFIQGVLTPVPIFVHSARLLFKRKFWYGNDGMTDRQGRSLDSFTLGAAVITKPTFGQKSMLVPHIEAVGVKQWTLEWKRSGEEAPYDAEAHADFIASFYEGVGVEPEDLLVGTLDTTFGNPKMTKMVRFADAGLANLELN